MILFELLTGYTAFERETLPELIYAIVNAPLPSPAERRPDLPPALATAISRALTKNRDERFLSLAELAAALAPFCELGQASAARIARILHHRDGAPRDRPTPDGKLTAAMAERPLHPGEEVEPATEKLPPSDPAPTLDSAMGRSSTGPEPSPDVGSPRAKWRAIAIVGGLVVVTAAVLGVVAGLGGSNDRASSKPSANVGPPTAPSAIAPSASSASSAIQSSASSVVSVPTPSASFAVDAAPASATPPPTLPRFPVIKRPPPAETKSAEPADTTSNDYGPRK
jgi:eukaryotic-like serine/threonine-protein kinase